jgi:cell division protein FtsX
MAFVTMARMAFAMIGRMKRRMMTGNLMLIAIAIMKAIVVIMTVGACRIDRRAKSYRRSDRL